MKKCVVDNYDVHQGTMAIIAAMYPDYYSEVIEADRRIYVKRTPKQLISDACLEGGSTYEGRRRAVTHQTGARHKVPIPVDPAEEIYAFPTHSAKQFNCNWIFYKHVKRIIAKDQSHSNILFKNGIELPVNVSSYILEKQMYRTSYCMFRFSNRTPPPLKFHS